jgi:uncharacterized protein (TIGR00725 family)
MQRVVVSVFGSSRPTEGSEAWQTAYTLGAAIADAGWVVCNGGYGGTMAASAAGARSRGGHTVGVTCATIGMLPGRAGPNPFIVDEIPTFDLFQRIKTLMLLGNAYVVLPGSTGTLLELAAVWEFIAKGFLSPLRPIVLLGDAWTPVLGPIAADAPDLLQPFVCADVAGVMAALRSAGLGGGEAA